MIDEKSFESAAEEVTLTTILLAALDNLDYEAFCDFVDDGNPFAGILDMATTDAVTEPEFKMKKMELTVGVGMAGMPSALVGLAEILKGIDDGDGGSEEYEETEEPVASYKTVAKIKKAKQKKKKKDERRIKLTGEPAIDSEIIFNMVKRHK